jgi:hypothetical protein
VSAERERRRKKEIRGRETRRGTGKREGGKRKGIWTKSLPFTGKERRSCISANNNNKKIKTEEGSELEREWEKNTCCPFSLNSIFSVWFFLQRKEWVHVFKGKDVGF